MIKKFLLSLIILIYPIIMLAPQGVSAFSPFQGDCSGGSANGSAICTDGSKTSNPISGSSGILYKITILVAFISGIVAIILIIVSAIKFMTSGGDTQKVSSAKNSLVNTIIGLVIITLAASIISFVVGRL
jgi:hypothetical protein